MKRIFIGRFDLYDSPCWANLWKRKNVSGLRLASSRIYFFSD